MTTIVHINRSFYTIFFALGLTALTFSGCQEEPQTIESHAKKMLHGRTYFAFGIREAFTPPVRMSFLDDVTVEITSRKGEKSRGDYQLIAADSSFVISVPNARNKAEPFEDTCQLIYFSGARVWGFTCNQMEYDFISYEDHRKVAEYYANKQFRHIQWSYGQDKSGQWVVTLENRGELAFDSLAICVNGGNCDGLRFKVARKKVKAWEGPELEFRFPGSMTASGGILVPGKTKKIPVKEAVSQNTGRRFNPEEFGVAEIYGKGQVKYFRDYIEIPFTSLKGGAE